MGLKSQRTRRPDIGWNTLKSDQNGIEIGLCSLYAAVSASLKSDQNGIEITGW